jgi:N-methylhydantoinase A
VRTHRCLLSDDSLPSLKTTAVKLADAETERLGEQRERVTVVRWLELRYLGQNSELAIPWTPGMTASELGEQFGGAHRREYGFTTDDPIEATAVRCRLGVAGGHAWPAPDVKHNSAVTTAALTIRSGIRQEVPVRGLGSLAGVPAVTGPALIAARFGSITVCPGQRASLDADANVVVEAL